MAKRVTVKWAPPAGYAIGDYCVLYFNDGSGDIDTAVSGTAHQLFRRGAGIYGCGHTPAGKVRCGKCSAQRTAGCGHTPIGKGCCGHGSTLITEAADITECGNWLFAFYCYDQFGNLHTGTPEEAAVTVHMAPAAPAGLTKTSYNKTTDILILTAA